MLRDPLLLVPGTAIVGTYAYLATLGIGTPQNDADALVYHLTRSALWRQHQAIGWLGAESEPRIDGNPILAEIAQATAMVLDGSERFVWIGQWVAAVALALSTLALGRRLGLAPKEALFGALLVPLLPIVVVQSYTAYNDLVVGSFVLCAAALSLSERRADLVPFAAAIGLAVATKFTAVLLLPLVGALVLLARPRRDWSGLTAAGIAGAALGSGWFVVNLVRTGELDAGLAEAGDQEVTHTIPVAVFNLQSQILDLLELPGARGAGAWLYAIAGGLVTLVLLVRRSRSMAVAAVAGSLVAVAPLVVTGVGAGLQRLFVAGWDVRGEAEFAMQLRRWEPSRWADGLATSFGPLLPFVVLGVAGWVIARRRRGDLSPAALFAATAPFTGIVVVALTLPDDPWRGRFLVGAVAMSAALWGLILRVRWLAASVVAAALATLALVLVNADGKPSGLSLLHADAPASVWTLERWEAQTLLRTLEFTEPENATIAWVEEHVPEEPLALALRYNDLTFPYVGESLDRPIRLVADRTAVPPDSRWLVTAPGVRPLGCDAAWRVAHDAGMGWLVWRRAGADMCATIGTLDRQRRTQ